MVYLIQGALGLFVTTLHGSSFYSAKTILGVAVYLTGLTLIERHQTQSRIRPDDWIRVP